MVARSAKYAIARVDYGRVNAVGRLNRVSTRDDYIELMRYHCFER